MVQTKTSELLRQYPAQFMVGEDDMRWLFQVHLLGIVKPAWAKSFILYGSEDAPVAVELFDKLEVTINTYPTFTIFFQ